MANQSKPPKRGKNGVRHHLLLYRFIANRYRPPAILLFMMGFLLLLPTWIVQLRFKTIFTYQQLAYIGIASIVCGVGLIILAIFMEKQAYVRCRADHLQVHTMSKNIKLPYSEINSVQSVLVGQVYIIKELKGRDREFMEPLKNEQAVEVEVSQDFWKGENKIRKGINNMIFSPRKGGFILIVEGPSQFSIEINRFTQESLDRRSDAQTRYLDPIERLEFQGKGR
jgi:hypothetical protein